MYNKVMNEIKEAMKNKEVDKRDVLKMAVAKAQAIAKENKCDVTDDIMMNAIQKELKQLSQTKDSLKGREDSDLYKSTLYKIDVLNSYLPKMLDEAAVMETVELLLSNKGVIHKGAAMKIVMGSLLGKADNKVISICVDRFLKNS